MHDWLPLGLTKLTHESFGMEAPHVLNQKPGQSDVFLFFFVESERGGGGKKTNSLDLQLFYVLLLHLKMRLFGVAAGPRHLKINMSELYDPFSSTNTLFCFFAFLLSLMIKRKRLTSKKKVSSKQGLLVFFLTLVFFWSDLIIQRQKKKKSTIDRI